CSGELEAPDVYFSIGGVHEGLATVRGGVVGVGATDVEESGRYERAACIDLGPYFILLAHSGTEGLIGIEDGAAVECVRRSATALQGLYVGCIERGSRHYLVKQRRRRRRDGLVIVAV